MDSISTNGKEVAEAIRSYVKPIFGFALNRVKHRAEAEDLAQEIMLQLLKSFSGLRDIRSLDAYVWTVARYTWVNWLKKREHAPQVIEINGMSELSAAPSREPLDPVAGNRSFTRAAPRSRVSVRYSSPDRGHALLRRA